MSVIRIGSGAPWEGIVGYSRVVVRGDAAWVSGTTSMVDGAVAHDGDAAAQTRQALAHHRAGAGAGRVLAWTTSSAPGCSSPTSPAGRRSAARTARSSGTSGRPRRWSRSPR